MVARVGVMFTQCFKVILKQLVPRERGISFLLARVSGVDIMISNVVGTNVSHVIISPARTLKTTAE